MKKYFVKFYLLATAFFTMPVMAQSGLNIHIDKNGIDIQPETFMSYYQAPAERVNWLQGENIPEAQWPLLFEISRAGNVTTDRVWELRKQAASWLDVLNILKVPPSYFYYDVPDPQRLSPPYGRAYGYYRNHPTETVHWTDQDLVRLSSVRYITESTHRSVHEAIGLYQKYPHFVRSPVKGGSQKNYSKEHSREKSQQHESKKNNGGHDKHKENHGQHNKNKHAHK